MVKYERLVSTNFLNLYEDLVRKYQENAIDLDKLLKYGLVLGDGINEECIDVDEIDDDEEFESQDAEEDEVDVVDDFFYRKLLSEHVVSFRECAEYFRKYDVFEYLFQSLFRVEVSDRIHGEDLKRDLQYLIDQHILSSDDIRYIFDRIPNELRLYDIFVSDNKLLKYGYEHQMLNVEDIKRFNVCVEEAAETNKWMRDKNITNFFLYADNYIRPYDKTVNDLRTTDHQNLRFTKKYDVPLIEMNNVFIALFSDKFTESQKYELYELYHASSSAKQILHQLVENNVFDTYDFDSLKKLIVRDDNKKKVKMNF